MRISDWSSDVCSSDLPLIEASPGFISLEIRRPMATGQAYLLLVKWRSIADHRDGFRQSDRYQQWRALMHHFYDPMPEVSYFGEPLCFWTFFIRPERLRPDFGDPDRKSGV